MAIHAINLSIDRFILGKRTTSIVPFENKMRTERDFDERLLFEKVLIIFLFATEDK